MIIFLRKLSILSFNIGEEYAERRCGWEVNFQFQFEEDSYYDTENQTMTSYYTV